MTSCVGTWATQLFKKGVLCKEKSLFSKEQILFFRKGGKINMVELASPVSICLWLK